MSEKELEKLTYEEAFAELELIAGKLESENQALEESLKMFERGQLLASHCTMLLEKAQLRIQKIDLNGIGDKEQ